MNEVIEVLKRNYQTEAPEGPTLHECTSIHDLINKAAVMFAAEHKISEQEAKQILKNHVFHHKAVLNRVNATPRPGTFYNDIRVLTEHFYAFALFTKNVFYVPHTGQVDEHGFDILPDGEVATLYNNNIYLDLLSLNRDKKHAEIRERADKNFSEESNDSETYGSGE